MTPLLTQLLSPQITALSLPSIYTGSERIEMVEHESCLGVVEAFM